MADRRGFRTMCHEAARRTGGSVREFRFAEDATPNFDQGVIGYPDRTVAVVRVRDSLLVAVAEPRAREGAVIESGPLTFLDEPALLAALTDLPGVRVFSKAELDAPFDAAGSPGIDPADITYWQPGTVGEALFHYWD